MIAHGTLAALRLGPIFEVVGWIVGAVIMVGLTVVILLVVLSPLLALLGWEDAEEVMGVGCLIWLLVGIWAVVHFRLVEW